MGNTGRWLKLSRLICNIPISETMYLDNSQEFGAEDNFMGWVTKSIVTEVE